MENEIIPFHTVDAMNYLCEPCNVAFIPKNSFDLIFGSCYSFAKDTDIKTTIKEDG